MTNQKRPIRHNMAAPRRSFEEEDAFVFVFDRRSSDAPEIKISTGGVFTFADFKARVCSALNISQNESFVISTTNREEICSDDAWDLIDKGDTLYVLKNLSQELCAPAEERVNYLPHYDTIVKGGMYEYYASEGQNPLPYAFAELIDNALAATAMNEKSREIEIRLHFDDSVPHKNCVIVIDNGKGMTPRQLNNWAIYRLSKFIRQEKKFQKDGSADQSMDDSMDGTVPDSPVARYMNSDISYFGVGGKQAIFFIGNSTRMISKPKDSFDVHELVISKDEFEKREKNNQSIYSGVIHNRKPGDASHLAGDEDVLARLIEEEKNRDSFTAVVIQSVSPAHIPYLKQMHKVWTRQLAHIYHFYLHGANGNVENDETSSSSNLKMDPPVNVKVKIYPKGQAVGRVIDLRTVEDDMQTLFARTAASTFEFKAMVDGTSAVEGMLRYHPFLFDRETFPSDAYDPRMEPEVEDDHGYAINEQRARGKRPVFECYWNGRLIPYTLIEDFDWCAVPKKNRSLPVECYNRISGVLWTNDTFKVSTNKLTFLDLEIKLREKNTVFTRMVNRHDKRTQIDKEFTAWLKECHEKHDKQILFSGFKGVKTRSDVPRHKQYPWSFYMQVEWDGCVFKKGQMVKVTRAAAPLYGTIQCFMLYGDYDGDVYSTGGEVEIAQEPVSLYDEKKVVQLSKLDRTASQSTIKYYIDEEMAKLPSHLVVSWPNGMEVVQNEKRPAGKTIGDIKVEISNRRKEYISKIPGSSAKKLLVELKVIWHSPHGDEVIVSHLSQHGKNWPYWFRKMENMKNIGGHTIQLQTVLNESGATTYAGHQLPSYKIKFYISEGEAERFTVGMLEGPFKMAVPFSIPLEFQDKYRNPTKPPVKVKPSLTAEGLELEYDVQVRGTTLTIKNVLAKGSVPTAAGKNFSLVIKIDDIKDAQTLKVRFLPGPPATLDVAPKEEVTVENGSTAQYNVMIYDAAGNATGDGRQVVNCWFTDAPGVPMCTVNTSSTGAATLTTAPINLKKLTGNTYITARFELQNQKGVPSVERKLCIHPSSRASALQVYRTSDKGEKVLVKDSEEIVATVGESIKGLSFKLLDEAEREIAITEKMANKIKVNWVPKVNVEELVKGTLPAIKVPTSVTDARYCNVSVVDSSATDCRFSVKGKAGEVSRLQCLVNGQTEVEVNQVLPATIIVSLTDTYGNPVKIPSSAKDELEIQCDDLDSKAVKITLKSNQLLLENLKFTTQLIGVKRLRVRYQGLEDMVQCEVMAGPPAALDMPDWSPDMPVTVYADSVLPFPIRVQLLDASGSLSLTPDIRVHLTRDTKCKLIPHPQPMKTNAKGMADFGVLCVSGPIGVFEFQAKAMINRTVISGPKIQVSIEPNPMKPKELKVDLNNKESFIVGKKMPEVKVQVIAEDDSLLKTTDHSRIYMRMWKSDNPKDSTIPDFALSYTPDTPDKSTPGQYIFRNYEGPTKAGAYNIVIVYIHQDDLIPSKTMPVILKPDMPVGLVAAETPGMPTVSNTRNLNTRCLLKLLKLVLQDQYGNTVTEDYRGEVKVSVTGSAGGNEIPMLVGGTRTATFGMTKGQSILQNLTIQENSPGKDGMEYKLSCTLSCSQIPQNQTITDYHIPFLFYNDAKKLTQMSALSKERATLQETIQQYKAMFQTQKALIDELRSAVHIAAREEQNLRAELRKQSIPGAQLQDKDAVEKLMAIRVKERDQLLNKPRRSCGLLPAPEEPDVLGKIGYLAMIENSDIARVISWHMSADMDCVVTFSTKKAQEIYSKTQGRQQVLPLDSIYRKNLPDWGKPLPHVRYRPNWKPAGRPMYARNLLIFPVEQESCQLVFGMLLGDTLILDNLDNANAYRMEIIKHSHCPTILTWQGDRIRSNGKFGGTMNKAVPLEKLRGAVFGEPLPMSYHALCTQITTLSQYKSSLDQHLQAQDELQEVIMTQKSPDMSRKYKECQEAETKLASVERQMGVGVQAKTRPSTSSPSRGENGPSAAKRSRLSSSSASPIISPVSNGNQEPTDPFATPTRTSLRIRSMTTVVSDDGRKKLRKT